MIKWHRQRRDPQTDDSSEKNRDRWHILREACTQQRMKIGSHLLIVMMKMIVVFYRTTRFSFSFIYLVVYNPNCFPSITSWNLWSIFLLRKVYIVNFQAHISLIRKESYFYWLKKCKLRLPVLHILTLKKYSYNKPLIIKIRQE